MTKTIDLSISISGCLLGVISLASGTTLVSLNSYEAFKNGYYIEGSILTLTALCSAVTINFPARAFYDEVRGVIKNKTL